MGYRLRMAWIGFYLLADGIIGYRMASAIMMRLAIQGIERLYDKAPTGTIR